MSIVDDDELKYLDQYSEKTTLERFKEASDHIDQARPPLDMSWQKRKLDEDDDESPIELKDAASNHWVVSGQHTESGFPIHANDFHSGRDLPARMTISELSWGEHSIFGGQFGGIPGVISGRNKNFSWSMTIALGDSTDIW